MTVPVSLPGLRSREHGTQRFPVRTHHLQVPRRLPAAGLDGVGAEPRAEGPALPTDLRGPRRAGEAWPRGLHEHAH